MSIVNYTPHEVRVRSDQGWGDWVYPPCGVVARVAMRSAPAALLADACPTITVEYGTADLPAGHPGLCIVSTMFADAYRRQHGDDGIVLLVPDSGTSAIRENGQIVAVRALIRR